MGLRHKVRINISTKGGERREVLRSQSRRLPRRLLTALFGEFGNILVLAPGETVKGIEIMENPDVEEEEGYEAIRNRR